MRKIGFLLLITLFWASSAVAGKYDIEFSTIGNDAFGDIVREVGMVTAYRGVAPAEPLGLLGFDVGIETSFADIDTSKWDPIIDAGGSSPPSALPIPRLHVRKGLPLVNIDLGASYSAVPDSNIEIFGAEVQWALLEGGVATPALAVRGGYSTLEGVDDIDVETLSGDVIVSKGFLMFTPYAGAGIVKIDGKYTGSNALLQATLDDRSATETRIFGGLQTSIALLKLTAEAEFSEIPVYTIKLSMGW